MKPFINKLIIILFLGCAFQSNGQFLVKGGFTFADLSNNDKFDFSTSVKTNLFLGVHLPINLGAIGVEPGITYYKLNTAFKSPTGSINVTRDYIGIPVLIKIFPSSTFSFGGGLQAGFLANDSFGDNFKTRSFDVSGQLQVTLNLLTNLGVEGGYNYGFTPFFEFDNETYQGLNFREGSSNNKYYYLTLVLKI